MGRARSGSTGTAVMVSPLTAQHLLHIMSATAHTASSGNLSLPPQSDPLGINKDTWEEDPQRPEDGDYQRRLLRQDLCFSECNHWI